MIIKISKLVGFITIFLYGCGYLFASSNTLLTYIYEQTVAEKAAELCRDTNNSEVYTYSDYIKAVSNNMGGGTTYYIKNSDNSYSNFTCPTISQENMTNECKIVLGSNMYWNKTCTNPTPTPAPVYPTVAEKAAILCKDTNNNAVYTYSDYIKAISNNIGGGTTYYIKNYNGDFSNFTCPTTSQENMTNECKIVLGSNMYWNTICEKEKPVSVYDKALELCTYQERANVYTYSNYIKAVSNLEGAGTTYFYLENGKFPNFTCPIVNQENMSNVCKIVLDSNMYWNTVCEKKKFPTLEEKARQLCSDTNTADVSTYSNYIKAVSKLEGGGTTYYIKNSDNSYSNFTCPVINQTNMSNECKIVLGANIYRNQICTNQNIGIGNGNDDTTNNNTTDNTVPNIIDEVTNTVDNSSELQQAINWMYNNQLTKYNTIQAFRPDSNLTRQEAAKFFTNYAKKVFNLQSDFTKQCKFYDTSNADPTLTNFIEESCYLGILKGSQGNFSPFANLTQAQALAVLMRMKYGMLDESTQPWWSNYFNKIDALNIIDTNWTVYSVDTNITRGQVAILFFRLSKI